MLSTVILATAILAAPGADLCQNPEPGTLAAGTYSGHWNFIAKGQGGAKVLNLALNYGLSGKVRFEVGDDGVIKNAQSDVELSVYGTGQGQPGGVAVVSASFTGNLVQTGQTGAKQFTLTGKVSGRGGTGVTLFQHADGAGGAGGGEIGPITFTLKSAGWCGGTPDGSVASPVWDKMLADSAARGMAITRGSVFWTARESSRIKKAKDDLLADLDKATQLLQGGGEDLKGSQAFPRFRALAQKVRQERSERLRHCLTFWFAWEIEKRFGAKADQLIAKLNALSSDPNALTWIQSKADQLFVLSYELVELGLDDCKKALHEKIVNAVTAKLKAVVDEGVRKRVAYSSEQLLKPLTGARVQGKVAPGLVKAAAEAVRAYHRRGGR